MSSRHQGLHAWQARVAEYFASQMDGGMIGSSLKSLRQQEPLTLKCQNSGSRITLATIVEGVHNGRVPQDILCAELFKHMCSPQFRAGSEVSFREYFVPWQFVSIALKPCSARALRAASSNLFLIFPTYLYLPYLIPCISMYLHVSPIPYLLPDTLTFAYIVLPYTTGELDSQVLPTSLAS